MPNQVITALLEILSPEIGLSKKRLETLCLIVIGMVSARSVNLSHLACERSGTVQTASTYRRLQRFLQHVRLDDDWALPLLIRLLGLKGSWLLALNRTNWQIGKTEVKYLVLAVVTPRFRVPLVWSLVEGRGCSDTEMRIAQLLNVAAKPLKGEWLIVVTNVAPSTALETYRKRWAIECLFGDAKTPGLNLEDTRLTDPRKLGLLMSLVALALGWAGRAAADVPGKYAPPRKSHGYCAKSWFRSGFDYIRNRLRSNPLEAIEPWQRITFQQPVTPRVV
ncbi:transposase [Sedimentitalea sp.]|uniref:transposase n=1 Tax=Sedimentitalea sp. TaxID=2048915 RepID=UPI00329A4FF8